MITTPNYTMNASNSSSSSTLIVNKKLFPLKFLRNNNNKPARVIKVKHTRSDKLPADVINDILDCLAVESVSLHIFI
jgi:hypothetical protein